MDTGIKGRPRSIAHRTIVAIACLALAIFASASAAPCRTPGDDCRDPVIVACCDFLTLGVECIIDPIVGGCVPWEPWCCDEMQHDLSQRTHKAVPGELYEASNFNLNHTKEGCPYYKAFCDFEATPVCQYEDQLCTSFCWDQTQILPFDSCD